MSGSELWIISTPIGNLEDCSIRLKKTIERCDILLVESSSELGGRIRTEKMEEVPLEMGAARFSNKHKKLFII